MGRTVPVELTLEVDELEPPEFDLDIASGASGPAGPLPQLWYQLVIESQTPCIESDTLPRTGSSLIDS